MHGKIFIVFIKGCCSSAPGKMNGTETHSTKINDFDIKIDWIKSVEICSHTSLQTACLFYNQDVKNQWGSVKITQPRNWHLEISGNLTAYYYQTKLWFVKNILCYFILSMNSCFPEYFRKGCQIRFEGSANGLAFYDENSLVFIWPCLYEYFNQEPWFCYFELRCASWLKPS